MAQAEQTDTSRLSLSAAADAAERRGLPVLDISAEDLADRLDDLAARAAAEMDDEEDA